jgi:hypothetical protein
MVGPVPRSPKSLRREADELEHQAADLDRRARAARTLASALRTAADAAEEIGVLQREHSATLDRIVTSSATDGPPSRQPSRPAITDGEKRRRLGIAKGHSSTHPFPTAVLASGSTVADWAATRGLKPVNVRSWFARGEAARPIPRRWAEEIEKAHGIPATAAIWPRGIKG